MKWATLGIFVLAGVAAGCTSVVSLQPPFTQADLAPDPALVGTWVLYPLADEKEGTAAVWTVRAAGGAYDLTIPDENGELFFKAYLVRLDQYLFLDIVPNDATVKRYRPQLVPVHMVFRMWMDRDALLLAAISEGWLSKRIARGEVNLAHIRVGDDLLLTGSTKELREFALQYAQDSEAFIKVLFLVRQ
jgi:hypothetical protein